MRGGSALSILRHVILPNTPQHAGDVAGHYDELDRVYRECWGEHVHHGLWTTGREPPERAVEALIDMVADRLEIAPAMACADIGCGYGGTARRIATTRGAAVRGFTLSAEQAGYAAGHPVANVTIEVRDWLANDLPDAAFDRAWSIESSEHMVDKPHFFAEAHRVLKPGARFAVCAWLAETGASPRKVRHLLEPICREGRLPSMGTREEYEDWARDAGFVAVGYEDISRKVAKTWTICARRFVGKLLTDRWYRRLLRHAENRVFALSVPRLILAYRTGAMRYGVFVWEKI